MARRNIPKPLISAFIILNLFTILFSNHPFQLAAAANKALEALPPMAAYRIRWSGWLIMQYAHLVGLDNRWTMFAHNSRFNWWDVIKARYADGAMVALPLPLQIRRTFWEQTLTDFKEVKFHLSIYNDAAAKRRYARYLCRAYPRSEGSLVTAIVWERHYQNILNPSDAATRGTPFEPTRHVQVLDTIPCAAEAQLR